MDKDQLQKSISILYDMEKNNYLMTRAISKLDGEISLLCRQRFIEPPKLKESQRNIFDQFWLAIPFGIVGAIIGIILGIISLSDQDFTVIIFAGLFVLAVCAIIGAIIGGAIGLVIGLIIGYIIKSKENEKATKEYGIAKENYKRRLYDENTRISNESKRRDLLLYQKSKLIDKRRESKKLLDSFYNIVGIDAKFRNLIPIAYMDEFMRLGIATKLEGADGLYYLTRRDLREDQINATLERIVEKLDVIIDNLEDIKGELIDINKKCDSILNETIRMSKNIDQGNRTLSELKDKTEVLTYYTERNNRELEYQNFMMYIYK